MKNHGKKKRYGLVAVLLILNMNLLFAQMGGDANGDSRVSILDALMTAQYTVGLNPPGFNAVAADADCSGRVTIVDALYIAQFSVGLVTEFPCFLVTPTPVDTTYCHSTPEPVVAGSYQVLNPGSSDTLYTSEHFVVRWNAADGVVLSPAEVQAGLNALENIWDKYINELGFQPPYYDTSRKYKVSVNVSNQGWATGAGTGARDPEMWVHYNAYREVPVLAHEFAHTLQYATRGLRDSDYVGWMWESHAEWMRHQYFRDQVNCAELLVNYPHLYYGSTRDRYCNWHFWEFLKDKYCVKVINDIWSKAPEPGESGYNTEDPFNILARNFGWSFSRLNDEFGDWAMHNATWDYSNGAVYASLFGSYDDRSGTRRTRVTMLEELDHSLRRYVVPEYWAPQRWGYNLVRLVPDNPGQAGEVRVNFRGIVQSSPGVTGFGSYALQPSRVSDPDSGWRWGLVAREASGKPRYSLLQSGSEGELNFSLKTGDSELWLVVVGAPAANHKIFWDQIYYTIYRYPWMVQMEGAWPEGYHPREPDPPGNGGYHSNGGGWVASSARVDASAYVGPDARVLENAVVSGNARIEDWAIVRGNARVRDNAVISGHASVLAGEVYENACVGALTVVENTRAKIHGSARVFAVMNSIGGYDISGTAQLYGDIELSTSLNRGVYYGMVDSAVASDAAYGAYRVSPVPEVTLSGPFTW